VSDWKKVLSGVAPTLATALGGPFAGVATKFIAGKLLGDESATEDQLKDFVLSANPDALAKVKEIDNAFKAEMKRLDIDLERIAAGDRADARDLAKDDMRPQVVLSVIFVAGYFAIMYVMFFSGAIELTESQDNAAYMLLGVLTTGIPMILRFWFGGSPQDKSHMDRIYNSIPSHKIKK
jgi:hypothetical protein